MSILIQTGHKSSYSSHLVEKLYERGLEKPLPSYTHKLSYIKVVDTIDKILTANNASVANTKLADNIMVDFLLANLDQENWGWASDKNLTALEYWQQLEPNVKFVMVFDHPKYLFTNLENKEITTDDIDGMMEEWISYHTLMLDILNRYSDKTILIEGACAVNNIANLNEKVESIASTLKLKSSWQIQNQNNEILNSNKNDTDNSINNVAVELIADEILHKFPGVIELFNKLLDVAAMKCSGHIYKTKRVGITQLINSFNYLQNKNNHYENERSLIIQQLEKQKNEVIESLQNENNLLKSQLIDNKKELAQLELSKKKIIDEELVKRQYENSSLSNIKNDELIRENELLVLKLHQAQEELEYTYSDNKNLKKIEQEFEADKLSLMNQLKQAKDELDKLKDNISLDDKPLNIQDDAINSPDVVKDDELIRENELLILQLHQLQEELERYYIENKQLRERKSQEEDIIQKNMQSEESANYYGAAERVKQDLPYRIGSQVVKAKSVKNLAALPFTLVSEYRSFKSNEINNKSLPDLDAYKDAFEADRVKSHLSYKVGKAIVDAGKSPWNLVAMPKRLSKEIIDFYKNKPNKQTRLLISHNHPQEKSQDE